MANSSWVLSILLEQLQTGGSLNGATVNFVAIARTLVTRPAVLFADEPTGSLDSTTSHELLTMLRDLVDRGAATRGREAWLPTIVMVTHDPTVAAYTHRVVFLADGQLAGELVAQRRMRLRPE